MLYSSIFFICFIHKSLYLLIPNSLIILPPPPFPFGNQQVYSLCLWVYLCLINKLICVLFQFNRSVVSDSLWPHGLQYIRLPCPSPTPGACSNSCPLSQWCRPTISSSITPFPSCCQSFPASEFFPMSHRIRWPKYWSFSFSISAFNEYSSLISFRIDWLDLLAVQGTLNSLLQHHSSKASILWHSAFFMVQL